MKKPPSIYNDRNEIRKVGFELEYSGPGLREVSEMITSLYGGKIVEESNYFHTIRNSRPGDFRVKLDSSFLYEKKYLPLLEKFGYSPDDHLEDANEQDQLERVLRNVAGIVVPHEVVTPPVAIRDIPIFRDFIRKLRSAGARGTGSSLLYAFATHLNPEAVSLSSESILAHLRAFLLLYPWLLEELDIDPSRKFTSFINPFPGEYVLKVLNPEYCPDPETFIQDYVNYNPVRNRPLDLYPMLSYQKPSLTEKEKTGNVNPRPAYHYRLPNSQIDRSGWGFESEWKYWVLIENLAEDRDLIRKLSLQYLKVHDKSIFGFDSKWVKHLRNSVELSGIIS